MDDDLRVSVSRYASFLLRHNPEGLLMSPEGFVDLDRLASKVKARYPIVTRNFLVEMVAKADRKRFEIVGNRIRALYGHTVPVHVQLEEDKQIERLYHGTTPQAANRILEDGLQPMKRRWVHLSPTAEIAKEVGKRRAIKPVVLSVDAATARREGVRFYRATDKVYLCKHVPGKYIRAFHG